MPNNSQPFQEAVTKNLGITNLVGFLFGLILALLLEQTGTSESNVTLYFALPLLLIFLVWLTSRLFLSKQYLPYRVGPVSMLVLGFGIGALIYTYRAGPIWVWQQARLANSPQDWLMVALFLFGVIMGFFVVRNWSKDQDDFTKSVIAAVGGALLTPLLSKVSQEVKAFPAFVYYFLGFSISGALNLISASVMTANYSTKRSMSSRSVLTFLYGGDKADAVDKQFLKNIKDDQDYVRRLLIDIIDEFKDKVKREFARKKEERRRQPQQPAQQQAGPLSYYQLLSILSDDAPMPQQQPPPPAEEPPAQEPPRSFTMIFRRIKDDEKLEGSMFRMGVSIKYQDNLEYIAAPGSYRKTLPYIGSVAGLALFVRKTIVMNRDRYKRFRTADNPDGIAPFDVEQQRGTEEIDFLSYICVPVASRFGQAEETPVGVIHFDTRLFIAPSDLGQVVTELETLDEANEIYRGKIQEKSLTGYANQIYDQDDMGVKYLEEMRAIVVPVLEIYLIGRQGSI